MIHLFSTGVSSTHNILSHRHTHIYTSNKNIFIKDYALYESDAVIYLDFKFSKHVDIKIGYDV